MTRMNKPPMSCRVEYRGIKRKETTRDKTRQDKTRQDKETENYYKRWEPTIELEKVAIKAIIK